MKKLSIFIFAISFIFSILLLGCINTPSISTDSIDFTGQPCGGVQGIPCPGGYSCEVERGEISDSFGKCVKPSMQNNTQLLEQNNSKPSNCSLNSSYLLDDLSCACPAGFEFDYSEWRVYKADAQGRDFEEYETMAECVPLGTALKTLCVPGKLYEESASKRRDCVCPKGFEFDYDIIGYEYNGSAESPIMGSTCVTIEE